jgi:hypothetical protein
LNNLIIIIVSLVVYSTLNNSTSVIKVITIFCLLAFYKINLLNKLIIYLWDNYLVVWLSVNNISDITSSYTI